MIPTEGAAGDLEVPPGAVPLVAADAALDAIRYDDRGLVPAVVQEDGTGVVLMLAWMDAEAVRRTLTTGRTWFWSRSRSQHWPKGATSGEVQLVRSAWYDCDGDSLLLVVEQLGGGACHTGQRSCFHRALGVPSGE